MPSATDSDPTRRGSRRGRLARRETGRSRTGCLECRKRRIKCDENKPSCAQCRKTDRSCSILDSAFKASSYTFCINEEPPASAAPPGRSLHSAHETGASVSGPKQYEDRNISTETDTQGLPVPSSSQLRDHVENTEHRYVDNVTGISTPASSMENGPTAALTRPRRSPCIVDDVNTMDAVVEISDPVSIVEAGSQNEDHILSPDTTSHIDPNAGELDSTTADVAEEPLPATFLFREYCENLAQGIDMFSYGHHCSIHILRLAQAMDLVKFVTCAAAAKQLGHMRHASRHTETLYPPRRVGFMHQDEGLDYLWVGARYYGSAIQSMALDISVDDLAAGGILPSETQRVPLAAVSPSSISSWTKNMTTEAKLMAACVMCQYEELSASRNAWAYHLDGLYRLLHLDKSETALHSPGISEAPAPVLTHPHALQSFFWYFVHDDFEESFISMRPTRTDPKNEIIWKNMGIFFVEGSGRLNPTGALITHGSDQSSRDKAILHMLVWILCRLANHSASKDRAAHPIPSPNSPCHGPDVEWEQISGDLDRLHASAGFLLDADIIQQVKGPDSGIESAILVKEAWFLSSTLAMAAVYFHMAKIMLLSCMPSEPFAVMSASTRAPDWITAYRKLHQEMANHAQHVISIALGSPPAAVKMHMLQPLYVAGRCLTEASDQDKLLEVLERMERELGMATGYRVRDLLRGWGKPLSKQCSDLDKELSDLSSRDE